MDIPNHMLKMFEFLMKECVSAEKNICVLSCLIDLL